MKVVCILPWKSIISKVSWQGRAVLIGIQFPAGTRDLDSPISFPGTFLQSWSYCAAGICPKRSSKERRNLGLCTSSLSMAHCVLVVICEGKKSIKTWRWEINKCNYISGYQQQTPDKFPMLFWCWGLADSVKKQG